MNFKTEYTFKAVATLLVYLNGSINFVIHIKQLTGFSRALKGYCVCFDHDYEVESVENVRLGRAGEPKGAAVGRAWEPERRRASMSQVQDAEK